MFETQGDVGQPPKRSTTRGGPTRPERLAEPNPLYQQSILLALEAADEVGAVRSRTALAILLYQQGQHEAALDLHREIEKYYRRLGDRPMLARVINNEGAFLLALGRWEDAARSFEQAARKSIWKPAIWGTPRPRS